MHENLQMKELRAVCKTSPLWAAVNAIVCCGRPLEAACVPKHLTKLCLSVWKVLLSVSPNIINKFKGTQRAKAEGIRPSREGRRGAAAFTVSHESLQPTVLDICHTHSLLSFFPSHSVFLRPTEARSQPACSIWLLLLQKQEILWDWSTALKWKVGRDKHLIAMEMYSNSIREVGRCSHCVKIKSAKCAKTDVLVVKEQITSH